MNGAGERRAFVEAIRVLQPYIRAEGYQLWAGRGAFDPLDPAAVEAILQ